MFGLGMGEIMLILVVALLVLGPQKLPDAAKQIGKAIRELHRHTQNLQETIEQDEHIGGTMRELKNALNEPILTSRPRSPATPPIEAPVTPPETVPVPAPEAVAAIGPVPAPAASSADEP